LQWQTHFRFAAKPLSDKGSYTSNLSIDYSSKLRTKEK